MHYIKLDVWIVSFWLKIQKKKTPMLWCRMHAVEMFISIFVNVLFCSVQINLCSTNFDYNLIGFSGHFIAAEKVFLCMQLTQCKAFEIY